MNNIIKRAYAIELARLCADRGLSPACLIKQAARAKTLEELERRQQEAVAAFEEKMRVAREQFEARQKQELAEFEEESQRSKREQAKRKAEWEREQEEFNNKLKREEAERGPAMMSRSRHDSIVAELVDERKRHEERIKQLEADQATMSNPGAAEKVKDYDRMREENQNLQRQRSDAEQAKMNAERDRDAAKKDLSTETKLHEETRKAHADVSKRLRSTVDKFDRYKNRPWHEDITGGLSKGWTGVKEWASNNKPLSIAGGAALAGGLGYYIYNKVKKNRAKKRLLSALSE